MKKVFYGVLFLALILFVAGCSPQESPKNNTGIKNPNYTICSNECTPSGQTSCEGYYVITCGNYDNDSCLEWNDGNNCPYGCTNGYCNNQTDVGTIYARSIPLSAKVYVDNVYKGLTPKYIYSILVGQHTVKFTKMGYTDETQIITVTNNTINVTAYLKLNNQSNLTV